MKKLIALIIVSAMILIVLSCGKGEDNSAYIAVIKGKRGTNASGLIARIGGKEFDDMIKTMPPFMKSNYETTEGRKKFLDQQIDKKIMYLLALAKGYEKDAKIAGMLKRQEEALLLRIFYKNKIETLGKNPSEEEVKGFYDKNINDYTEKEKYQVSQIVFGIPIPQEGNEPKKEPKPEELDNIKKTAEKVQQELEKGADFEKMVEKYSIDSYSKERKGDLGFISKDSYIVGVAAWDEAKDYSKAIQELPLNTPSKVIQYKDRFYIIKVTKKTDKIVKPFKDVKSQVQSSFVQDLRSKTYSKIQLDLKKKADIKVDTLLLKKEYDSIKDKAMYPKEMKKDAPSPETPLVTDKGGTLLSIKDFRSEIETIPIRYRMMSLSDLKGLSRELDRVLERMVIAREAKSIGYSGDTEFLKEMEEYKADLLSKEFYQKEIFEKCQKIPTEDEIKKEYEKSKLNYYTDKGYIEAFHIVTKTKAEADAVYKEVAGQSLDKFKEVAKAKSVDNTNNTQGGALGRMNIDQDFVDSFVKKQPDYCKKAFELKDGEISQPFQIKVEEASPMQDSKAKKIPPPKIKEYYVIVRVEKNVQTRTKEYAEVKDLIKQRLTTIDDGATARAIFALRTDFDITINEKLLVVKISADQLFDNGIQSTANPDKAIECFEQLIKEYPNDKNIEKAMFMLGFLYWEQKNDKKKGREYFQKFVDKFPDSKMAKDAKAYLDGTIEKNMKLINEGKLPDGEGDEGTKDIDMKKDAIKKQEPSKKEVKTDKKG